MATDSLFLALAEIEMYDCSRSKKRQEWELLRNKDCNDLSTPDAYSNILHKRCRAKRKKNMFIETLDCRRFFFDVLKFIFRLQNILM